MNLQQFQNTLTASEPPAGISNYLQSLWYDATGDWEKAHTIIQDINDKMAAWIHGYLHRKEGDIGNADYWYSRAGKTRPNLSLEQEWEDIATALL